MLTSEEIMNYINVSKKITQWGYIISSIISIIGNPLAASIYLSKTFKEQSVRVYYPAVLIADIIPLIIGSSFYWAHYLFMPTNFYCKILIYLSNVSPVFSSWVMTILAIDRVIYIFYPNQLLILKKFKFQLACLLIAYILPSILILQLVVLLIPSPYENPSVNCVYLTPPGYDSRIYFMIYFIFYALLPFLIMITSSFLMIMKIRKKKQNAKTIGRNVTSRRNRKFAGIIIGCNFYFLISVLPYCVINIISFILQSINAFRSDTYAYLSFLNSLANLLLHFYYSTAIIIHIICNRLFRKNLMRRFTSLKTISLLSRINYNTNNL
jgi:hypothetical protein